MKLRMLLLIALVLLTALPAQALAQAPRTVLVELGSATW